MELIQTNSEAELSMWLPVVEKDPAPWMCVHISLSRVHEETLSKEGTSSRMFDKIHQISVQMAHTLSDLAIARKIDGKTFIFEDGDVLALLHKAHADTKMVVDNIQHEFASNELAKILEIYDMRDRLPRLVALSVEKKDTAALSHERKQLTHLTESILELAEPDPEATRTVQRKRRRRSFDCALIIEDDVLTRGLVATVLKDNFNVVQAKDAPTGIAAYAEHGPDIVFLDIHLPGLNGHEILKRIRTLDPQAYIVMLSADSIPENVISSRTHGAAGFIRKPFSKEKLLEYIRKCPTIRMDATSRALGWDSVKSKQS